MDKNIFLSPTEQDSLRKVLNESKISSVTDFLADAAKKIEDGKDWAESLAAAAPWVKEFAIDASQPLPIVGAALKAFAKWLEPNFKELAAIACTMAYQAAVRDALTAEKSFSVEQFRAKQKIDANIKRQIRNASPAEQADLSTFTLDDATNHIFVRRADRALAIALDSIGYDDKQKAKIFNQVHDGFAEKLKSLMYDSKTAEKFQPLKSFFELGNDEKRAHIALAAHAEYQREQYESAPVFRFEPFALKNVYVETECGVLDWQEIKKPLDKRLAHGDEQLDPNFSPFDENYGGRHNLVETVMGFIRDESFNEPIVLQGEAGAGKSSFTIRLSAELLAEGFCPIRVRLKKLRLGQPLIEALPDAIELDEAGRLTKPRDMFLGGRIFNERYGVTNLCRYVLILDGWDELSLSADKTFRENVLEMLRQVRDEFWGGKYSTRVRVIVTGRPSDDVGADTYFLRSETKILTMRRMQPAQLRQLVEAMKAALETQPIHSETPATWQIPDLAHFEQIFQAYEQSFADNNRTPRVVEFDFDEATQPEEGNEEASKTESITLLPIQLEDDGETDNESLNRISIARMENSTTGDTGETNPFSQSLPRDPRGSSPFVRLQTDPENEEAIEPTEDDFDFDDDPVFIRNSESLDVLGSPLLAYLAIRVMAQSEGDLTELINQPTRLYCELTDMTCGGAGKYVGDQRDTISERDVWWRTEKPILRQLLQRTAAAMTINGEEYISKDQLIRRVFDDNQGNDTDEVFDRAEHESSLSKLMVSFFFKGGHPEMGCEFSHKSFREYLTAECIVETLKNFGRECDKLKFDLQRRRPKPERDFPSNGDDPRHNFSRRLSELLAPQWLKSEVVAHLEEMLRWEIQRSRYGTRSGSDLVSSQRYGTGSGSDLVSPNGLPAENRGATASRSVPAPFHQWELIRDGLADLWEWWVDGAHLRPQWGITGSGRSKQTKIETPYVQELIEWSAPLDAARQDTNVVFESATTMDAHLGDGLFRLCAWVHFFVAEADGWLDEREAGQSPTPEQLWQGVSAKEVFFWGTGEEKIDGEGEPPHQFQTSITQGNRQWRVFAPSGENDESFSSSIARINSAARNLISYFPCYSFGKAIDLRGAILNGSSFNESFLDFASLNGAYLDCASLNGTYLDRTDIAGANLNHTDLDGASLNGASLNGASLNGASLNGASLGLAVDLTWEQIDSAWIDKWTSLPQEFEELRKQKLERQQADSEDDLIELEDDAEDAGSKPEE